MHPKLASGALSDEVSSKLVATSGSDPGPATNNDIDPLLLSDVPMRGGSAPVSGSTSPHPKESASESEIPTAKASQTDNTNDLDRKKELNGYNHVTAGVFLTSVSVGANLLNLPQAMAHMGWLAVPSILVLGVQSCFCSCLLASCWEIVERLDPALSGEVRRPYPLIVQCAVGIWARHLVSLTVLLLDTLSAVMLLVLSSDLVTSIVNYAYPQQQATICLMTVMLGAFLCPFTWFHSPKNFWLIAVLGLTTSVTAWLLMLMKTCADYCNRASPSIRVPPSPLHMMVGLSGICNCFLSGGVQPSIQADMRERHLFSRTIMVVWFLITVIILSFGITSYSLIGSEVKSNVLHNLGSGKFRLSIQITMLIHVLTSFVIYINPLYQELEETLNIDQGAWRQYLFRTICMGLLLLVSEATPDFGNVLDIMSVLAVLVTIVLPPLLYLRLSRKEGIDIHLTCGEKLFLILLAATGLMYMIVAAFGTTAYVFTEQKQGTCFLPHQSSNATSNTSSSTTPANMALYFKAHILTLQPPG